MGTVHEICHCSLHKAMEDVTKKKTLDKSIFEFQPFVLRKPVGTGQGGDMDLRGKDS